jgi:hypothetical protein
MSILASPRFLPRVMAADAISCTATGAVQLGLTDTLARLTGLPAVLLTGTGLFLLAYAALAAWMARRPVPPRRLIGLVVAGNLAWAVGGVALLASGLGAQTALGVAWVLAQVVVVVALAQLQWMGLRATRPARGRMAAA